MCTVTINNKHAKSAGMICRGGNAGRNREGDHNYQGVMTCLCVTNTNKSYFHQRRKVTGVRPVREQNHRNRGQNDKQPGGFIILIK
ncbi:MAG TPA: hypothetical protein DCG73_06930 [Morganella sp. (in: Bacteria)]|nr:hypothetical protein [Morganella sp. (in: enterobacteria)]